MRDKDCSAWAVGPHHEAVSADLEEKHVPRREPSSSASWPKEVSAKPTLNGHARSVRQSRGINRRSGQVVFRTAIRTGGDSLALIGYARVSTSDQDLSLQLDALRAAGCAKVFEDRASGAKADRTGLAEALAYVREGDVLVAWKLDRLGRSLTHLIGLVSALEKKGAGLRSLTEAIDTTTPGGRLVFHLFGALGEFERDLIRERTQAGLTAAAARGRRGGRKPVVTSETLARARVLRKKGFTVREAAARLKVGKTALYEALRDSAPPSSDD